MDAVDQIDFDNVALTTDDFIRLSDKWMETIDRLGVRRDEIEELRRVDGYVPHNALGDYTYQAVNQIISGLLLLVGRANGKALRSRG